MADAAPGSDAAAEVDPLAALLASRSPEVRRLALAVRDRVRELVPDAIEEVDASAGLIGFTFQPGTYKGLFAAVAPQRSYVNLMFARGVELLPADAAGLLRGTGRKARHVRFDDPAEAGTPEVAALIRDAADRTPRP